MKGFEKGKFPPCLEEEDAENIVPKYSETKKWRQ
jgi:hypothetical protein